ncbi:MAG TPA: hypothetical protein VJI97_00440 [Candidatus Nanoarchaeia archaeon]|nr:hypothetical protein [Candidatus Nanoarchaeia archaeon]
MIAVSGQADPSYLWTDDVREIIISIHNECGRVIKILYKINKKKYKEKIGHIEELSAHFKKIKSDNEWIEKAQEGIDKMQRDLEVIIGDTAAKPAPKNAMGRRRFLRMTATAALGAAAGIAWSIPSLQALEIALKHEASKLPYNSPNGLAILIAKPETAVQRFGANFAGIYVSRMELALGIRAKKVVIGASVGDFRNAIYDENIQNLCILGHGSNDGWSTNVEWIGGGQVDFDRLATWYSEAPLNKKGVLLKHTCGNIPSEKDYLVFIKPEIYKHLEQEAAEFERRMNLQLGDFPSIYRESEIKRLKEQIKTTTNDYMMEISRGFLNEAMSIDYNDRFKDIPKKASVKWKGKIEVPGAGVSLEGLTIIIPVKNNAFGEDDSQWELDFLGITNELKKFNERLEQIKSQRSNVNVYPKLLGVPFFNPDRIMAWNRITYIQDFLLNPFANSNITFDKYSGQVMGLYKKIRGIV